MVFENIYYSTILAKWYGILAMTQINEKKRRSGYGKIAKKMAVLLYFRSSFIQLLLA